MSQAFAPRPGTTAPTLRPLTTSKPSDTTQNDDVYVPEKLRVAEGTPVVQPLTVIQAPDMKTWVFRPIPRETMLQLKLVRHEGGVERMYPWFELFLQDGPGLEYERFLLSAKKRKKFGTANYLISLSREKEDMQRHDDSYIGKVRSNFPGTEFSVSIFVIALMNIVVWSW